MDSKSYISVSLRNKLNFSKHVYKQRFGPKFSLQSNKKKSWKNTITICFLFSQKWVFSGFTSNRCWRFMYQQTCDSFFVGFSCTCIHHTLLLDKLHVIKPTIYSLQLMFTLGMQPIHCLETPLLTFNFCVPKGNLLCNIIHIFPVDPR